MTPAAERLARLRDFQHGRAPELAALTETRAAANLAALERRRPVTDGPQSAQGMLAEAIRVLAGAAGMPRRPVCERCARTLNLRGRTCRKGERSALAARVARCMASGDYAGADWLLSRPRTPRDWRRLALALASSCGHWNPPAPVPRQGAA